MKKRERKLVKKLKKSKANSKKIMKAIKKSELEKELEEEKISNNIEETELAQDSDFSQFLTPIDVNPPVLERREISQPHINLEQDISEQTIEQTDNRQRDYSVFNQSDYSASNYNPEQRINYPERMETSILTPRLTADVPRQELINPFSSMGFNPQDQMSQNRIAARNKNFEEERRSIDHLEATKEKYRKIKI